MVDDALNEVYRNYIILNKIYSLKKIEKNRTLVFLCVGNSKIWYDSFGPIVGSLLKLLDFSYYIYGNVKSNINAKNINEYIEMIYNFHKNPYIIVFDNAFSNVEKPVLKINEGKTICATFSDCVSVGDLSVTYCFNKNDIKNCCNHSKMLKDIKMLVRFMNFVLKN